MGVASGSYTVPDRPHTAPGRSIGLSCLLHAGSMQQACATASSALQRGVTAVRPPPRGVWSLAIAALSAKMRAVALMTMLIHSTVAARPKLHYFMTDYFTTL